MGLTSAGALAQVGVNVMGFSHHFGSNYIEDPNSFNPGLGFHWTFDRGSRTALEFNLGLYRDSFENINRHAGLAARVQLWGPFEMGVNVLLARSVSMNNGYALIYPLPFLSFRQPRFVINSVFIPEMGGDQSLPTIGLTATVFPFDGGFVWDDDRYQNSQRRSFLEFKVVNLTNLEGYRNLGIVWRRMFNQRHGMRLGIDLNGLMGLGDSSGLNKYEIQVLAQYLYRFSAEQKSGLFAAGGVRVHYNDEFFEAAMQYELLLNLGWEYSLNSTFSIFAETGLALSHGYEDLFVWDDYPDSQAVFKTSLYGDGVTIGLTAGL